MGTFLVVICAIIGCFILYGYAVEKSEAIDEENSFVDRETEYISNTEDTSYHHSVLSGHQGSVSPLIDEELTELIEISYSVLGYEAVGETSFTKEVSERMYNRLKDAEDEGELLDSDYLSEHMKGIHKKILRAIRDNMYEEGINPEDGMVEKGTFFGGKYSEYSSESSHSDMYDMAEDSDIEYSILLL